VSLDPLEISPEKSLADAKRVIIKEGIDVGSKREEDGTRMLGSPIGSEAYCVKYILEKFDSKYKSLFPKIIKLDHPHAAWRLFKNINVNSGLVHILRTTPPTLIQSAFPQIEKEVRQFLGTAVFGCVLSEQEWTIVQFPFGFGGWNVIPLEILSPCSYLASLLANKEAILSLRPNATERVENEMKETIALIKKNLP